MGVACCDSSSAPPDTRMVPKKGVVAKKDPLEAGDMMIDGEMVEGEMMIDGQLVNRTIVNGVIFDEKICQRYLFYYGHRGKAQPIRFLLEHLGLLWSDIIIKNHEEWEQKKDSLGLSFPNLPCYID